jgi:hypothetical protein
MFFSMVSLKCPKLRTAATPQQQMMTPGFLLCSVSSLSLLIVFVNCHVNWTCHQHAICSALKSMSFLKNPMSTYVTGNPAAMTLRHQLWLPTIRRPAAKTDRDSRWESKFESPIPDRFFCAIQMIDHVERHLVNSPTRSASRNNNKDLAIESP